MDDEESQFFANFVIDTSTLMAAENPGAALVVIDAAVEEAKAGKK